MENKFTILLTDDHRLFAEGLIYILQKNLPHADISVADSGEEAWSRIEANGKPDLLITDLSMPRMNGIELTMKVKERFPEIKVLVLTMHADTEMIQSILKAEAEGYVLKNSTARDIITAIQDIMNGSTHYGREVLASMIQKIHVENKKLEVRKTLTERELEVLKLIVEEYSSDEIAEKLFIGKRTVDTHRANILEKTGCKNLISLIKYAIRHQLVSI
ncbi:MAG TPA: response regulator transcription factor [Chryseosolibacter sp.]|nr:response regulator transcription factor [Chryseosolibacter sp.]